MGIYKQQLIRRGGLGLKNSLEEAINDEPDRFAEIAFKNKPDIRKFEDLIVGFRRGFNTENGRRMLDKMTTSLYKKLWSSDFSQGRVLDNLSGDSEALDRENERVLLETQTQTTLDMPLERKGAFFIPVFVTVKGKTGEYQRTKARLWSKRELEFLKVRKGQGKKPKLISEEFNAVEGFTPRSYRSVKNKVYRL